MRTVFLCLHVTYVLQASTTYCLLVSCQTQTHLMIQYRQRILFPSLLEKESQQYVYICKLHRNRVVVFADSMRAFSPWMFCDTWCFLSIWNISHCLMEIAMCMCTHRVFVSQSKRTRVSHCYCTVVFIIACSRGSCPV